MGKNNRINLVCVSDLTYLKHLKTLLKSLSLTNSNPQVHLTLINVKSQKKIIRSLKKIYKDIEFHFIEKTFNKSQHLKAFCANYRPHAIQALLKNGYKKILYVDVDTLFRKNINGVADLFDNFDIKIHFRDEDDRRFKVAAGVILVNNTNASVEFINDWSETISRQEKTWFADQITFYECYKKSKSDLLFTHLDKKFIDWDFKKESYVWVGKGNRKKKNISYLLEVMKIKIKFFHQR